MRYFLFILFFAPSVLFGSATELASFFQTAAQLTSAAAVLADEASALAAGERCPMTKEILCLARGSHGSASVTSARGEATVVTPREAPRLHALLNRLITERQTTSASTAAEEGIDPAAPIHLFDGLEVRLVSGKGRSMMPSIDERLVLFTEDPVRPFNCMTAGRTPLPCGKQKPIVYVNARALQAYAPDEVAFQKKLKRVLHEIELGLPEDNRRIFLEMVACNCVRLIAVLLHLSFNDRLVTRYSSSTFLWLLEIFIVWQASIMLLNYVHINVLEHPSHHHPEKIAPLDEEEFGDCTRPDSLIFYADRMKDAKEVNSRLFARRSAWIEADPFRTAITARRAELAAAPPATAGVAGLMAGMSAVLAAMTAAQGVPPTGP